MTDAMRQLTDGSSKLYAGLTTLLQKPESAANAPQALADYIRIIREEHTKRTGGTDPLAAAMETYKDKKGYGGKRT